MDNLEALTKALKDASTPSAAEGSFVSLVERYLNSSDISIRIATAETFEEVVTSADNDTQSKLLEDSALLLVTRLIRLVPYTAAAQTSLNTLLLHAKPKEVVLALSESLSEIEDELTGREGLSDTEDEGEASGEELAMRLDTTLRAYADVIPRLHLQRSTPTLLTLTDSLNSVLPHLAADVDIQMARRLLSSFNKLVSACWRWAAATSDAGGEQRALLTGLLNTAVTLLSPRIDARLAERWFTSHYPRYANSQTEGIASNEGQAILVRISDTLKELEITQNDLKKHLTRPSSVSPHASLAALTLLAYALPLHTADVTDSQCPPFEDCMPIMFAALSSSAIDSGQTYLWYLLTPSGKTSVTYENATMLLELLTPLMASAQSPLSLTMATKLIAELINAVGPPDDRILLYKQLLEDANPFEMVRVRAINMLRDAISSSDGILIPGLREQLAPILFTIPTESAPSFAPPFLRLAHEDPSLPPLTMSPIQLVGSMWPVWFTECANLLRLVLIKDEGNATGCRDVSWLAAIKRGWLSPQLERLQTLKEEPGEDRGLVFALDRWYDALHRLQEELGRL